jgi:indole-3-glycerol phosphate synthase/phosphoribosylanthranilate isomerase
MMRSLVEVHDAEETRRAIVSGARIIGINNRDLRDFRVDINTTQRLRALIPQDRVVVSESGLHTAADLVALRAWNVQALLVGEAIVTASDRAAKVRELSPLRVKICGVRAPEQALAAAGAGADYIGLVFYPSSRRLVTPEQAAAITSALRQRREAGSHAPKAVGVFVNESPEKINALAQACGLELAQLSGDDSPESCRAVHIPVIKAIRPRTLDDLESLAAYRPDVQAFLLDTPVAGMWGGTGAVGDWSRAAELARRHPTLLAGGLTPENVGTAIEVVQPWGVDVSSGVETNGSKDTARIQAFLAAARGTHR